jgi:hypothetical protein
MALSDVIRKVEALKKKKVKVGFFETSIYADSGTPVAYVASIHEFGAHGNGVNVPARPFMRPSVANHKTEWGELAAEQVEDYLDGSSDLRTVLTNIGLQMEGDTLEQLLKQDDKKPLSKITLLLRRWRDEGRVIDKSVVEEARRALAADPDITLSKNQRILDDTNYMISSLTHQIVKA